MKQCIDIYNKWIVAFVDGQWRHVYVSRGWVTVADWNKPNQHIGICREGAVDEAGAKNVEELATSPHALVAGPVLDRNILDRIACVRFGRSKTLNPAGPLACDWDDKAGIDEKWPRLALPAAPHKWTRTARSFVNS